jgi:hypothetical protein
MPTTSVNGTMRLPRLVFSSIKGEPRIVFSARISRPSVWPT